MEKKKPCWWSVAFTELRRPTTTTTPKVEIGLGYKSRKRAGQRLQQTRRQEAFYFEHRRTAATLEKETSFLFHFSPKKTEIFFVIFLSLSLLSRGAVATPRHPRSSSGRFSPQPTPSGNPKTTTQLFSSRSSGGIRRPRPPILPFRRDRNPPENHRPTGVSITRQVLRRCPTKSRSNNNNNNKND